jgi:hypothetical protein
MTATKLKSVKYTVKKDQVEIDFFPVNLNVLPLKDRVLIQLFYTNRASSTLFSADGSKIDEKVESKEIFNIARIEAISKEATLLGLNKGDVVHLQDEWLDPVPDLSRGMNPTTGEPRGFITLGKLMPYFYQKDKINFDETQKELLFLVPAHIIAVKVIPSIPITSNEQDTPNSI